MTIDEMITALQDLRHKELATNYFYFYVKEYADNPTQLTKKEIADIEESQEQAKQWEFIPEEEMEGFFLNAQKIFRKAIEKQKEEETEIKPKYPVQLENLLGNIAKFGGMSVDTSNEYLEHSKEFKTDFSFKADLA